MKKTKKKKFYYATYKPYHTIWFLFISKKIKKRNYIRYKKQCEKFYGFDCKKSYKQFWWMLFLKSIWFWTHLLLTPIIFLLMLFTITGWYTYDDKNFRKRILSNEDQALIDKELEELWKKEDEEEKNQK